MHIIPSLYCSIQSIQYKSKLLQFYLFLFLTGRQGESMCIKRLKRHDRGIIYPTFNKACCENKQNKILLCLSSTPVCICTYKKNIICQYIYIYSLNTDKKYELKDWNENIIIIIHIIYIKQQLMYVYNNNLCFECQFSA